MATDYREGEILSGFMNFLSDSLSCFDNNKNQSSSNAKPEDDKGVDQIFLTSLSSGIVNITDDFIKNVGQFFSEIENCFKCEAKKDKSADKISDAQSDRKLYQSDPKTAPAVNWGGSIIQSTDIGIYSRP